LKICNKTILAGNSPCEWGHQFPHQPKGDILAIHSLAIHADQLGTKLKLFHPHTHTYTCTAVAALNGTHRLNTLGQEDLRHKEPVEPFVKPRLSFISDEDEF
jgi:hypothetical protein